ncbi:hypothetical protein C8J57DRAFT_1222808 [Mycena rebaudengoi]|nr:hypothetical protein C8J57DRAFT_1222808 [Mycena rebaudengoi]
MPKNGHGDAPGHCTRTSYADRKTVLNLVTDPNWWLCHGSTSFNLSVTGKGLRKGKGAGISGKKERMKKEEVPSEKRGPKTGVDSTKRTTTNQELYKYKSSGV